MEGGADEKARNCGDVTAVHTAHERCPADSDNGQVSATLRPCLEQFSFKRPSTQLTSAVPLTVTMDKFLPLLGHV
jgi:hypothetical protein